MAKPKHWTQCAECGEWGDPARYHPYGFCVLIKSGQDPILLVKKAAFILGIAKPAPEGK